MRVNVYAEEMTDRVEIVEKVIDGVTFTGVRFYLYLPATIPSSGPVDQDVTKLPPQYRRQATGPFIHREGDDDSAAVTFWGKTDLRAVLRKALTLLDDHYGPDTRPAEPMS